MIRSVLSLAVLLLTALPGPGPGRADPQLPGNVLDPKSPREAWNVIRLATKNVERLMAENRMEEIPVQISYCSPALRALPGMGLAPEAAQQARTLTQQSFPFINAIALSAQQKNPIGVKAAYASLRTAIDGLARHFDPAVVGADIFFCAMHPDFVSEESATPCPKCGMSLLSRRIPYSFIYTVPGEPSMRLTAQAAGPVEAGRPMEVKVRLAKADGSPVLPKDLMVMHTQPIHLLIEEPGLGDYHHEHPVPTATPGEYAFAFTPAKTAPYRIWADLVPTTTGIQELPFADLPSTGQGQPPADTANRFTATAGGYQFALNSREGPQVPVKAGASRRMTIQVSDAAGNPVTCLEPVMEAFAHLVGFHDDFKTVVHLHPTGGDILNPALRGGPALGFMIYAPRPGFVRLYCQISIGGKMIFAPFNLNVVP
jgi:hypothetical protein